MIFGITTSRPAQIGRFSTSGSPWGWPPYQYTRNRINLQPRPKDHPGAWQRKIFSKKPVRLKKTIYKLHGCGYKKNYKDEKKIHVTVNSWLQGGNDGNDPERSTKLPT
jgi:hypothetical protein